MSNLKHISFLVAIALLLAGGGYAAGRYFQPPKTVMVERTKIEYVEKQVVVEKVKTEVQIVRVTDTIKNIAVDTHEERKPDGTVTIDTHTKDTTQEKTNTGTNATTDSSKATTTDKTEKIDQSRVTTITPKPTWSLSLQPGFDIAGALHHGDPYSIFPGAVNGLSLKHVVLGVSVDHHLIGPLHTGVWVNSAGAGGVLLRIEW